MRQKVLCVAFEEARCREENRQRKEQEIRLVKELVNKAEDYRIAKEIMQIFLLQKNSAFSPKNKSRKSSIVIK